MTTVEMIAIVAAVTQFLKKLAESMKIEIKGTAARIMTVIVGLGVVAYSYISEGKPFELVSFITTAVQVIVGSNVGYSLLKVARPKTT